MFPANTASQAGSNVHCTHVLFRVSVVTYCPYSWPSAGGKPGAIHDIAYPVVHRGDPKVRGDTKVEWDRWAILGNV